MTPLSRDTPVQRLRAQLQGVALSGRSESRVLSSRGTGALLGAMLHGAARLDAGFELTDLESTLVGLLQGEFSEEEAREIGRVSREEASVRYASGSPDRPRPRT